MVHADAQKILALLRAVAPLDTAQLERRTGISAENVQRAVAHLRELELARSLPKDAEKGQPRLAWEPTPKGVRENVPIPTP